MLYYGHVLVAMVPFDVPWSVVYAHNICLNKVYIIGFDSYFSSFVTVLIKACTELCLASTIDTRIGVAIIMRHLALYPYDGGKQHNFSV